MFEAGLVNLPGWSTCQFDLLGLEKGTKIEAISNEQFPLSLLLTQSDFRRFRVGWLTAKVGKLQSLTIYPVKLHFPGKRKVNFPYKLTNQRNGLSMFSICQRVLNYFRLLNSFVLLNCFGAGFATLRFGLRGS